MVHHELRHEVSLDGFLFRLVRARSLFRGELGVPLEQWAAEMHPAIELLQSLVRAERAVPQGNSVRVGHPEIAALTSAEAQSLELPPPCPYVLLLQGKGAFSEEGFSISMGWIAAGGGTVHGLKRIGASLQTAAEQFTLREPIFSLVDEVERLNALTRAAGPARMERLDARMVQIARVKDALAAATGDATADRYLSQLTIAHATGLGIDTAEAEDAPTFRPTLFGDVPLAPGVEDNEDVSPEKQALLPDAQARVFTEQLFPGSGAWSHYRLAEGAYVVLDKPVVAALRVVRKINASDPETRRKFRRDPKSYLIPELEAAGGTGDVLCGGTTFAPEEGAEYGDRVLGIAVWEGKAFSFKIPVTQNWFAGEDGGPEERISSIEVPGADEPLIVRDGDLQPLIDKVRAAKAEGAASFTHDGRSYPAGQADAVIEALSGLVGTLRPGQADAPAGKEPREPRKRLVLRVAENEEDLSYLAQMRDPDGGLAGRLGAEVSGLLSTPDPHQREAIAWLQLCFISGMPGVLLADDMGLGKTFEVLAFLHSLRQAGATDGRPVLIVAPSKLLDEWKEQVAIHLPPMSFGRPIYAYDRGLKELLQEKGSESELGRATLDVERLRGADWVLTTYETLRDHEFSFSKIRFRVAIFDEAQKIKSGASLLNKAAKAQQPDFVILMTGTPIENSTMDLWTLLDVAWPGLLGVSGKDFVATYGNGSDEQLMMSLKDRLVAPVTWGEGKAARTTPPVMLRRFKADILIGLPPKVEKRWPEEMPAPQARAYDAVLGQMREGTLKALPALQALRQICLHPEIRLPLNGADRQSLIDASARFRALFRVLKEAKQTDRAVLVFVDIRKAQDMLQVLIRDEFGLPKVPDVINGNTPTAAVAEIKRRFQSGQGFGALLLGPRSAGFGLTLTRATQVVHLNRWWNPAVEDQCSDRTHRKGQTQDVTVHLPLARHPRLGEESFDYVLDGLLSFKRSQSRKVIVPSAMTEAEMADFYARLATGRPGAILGLDDLDRRDWRSFELWVSGQFQAAGWQVYDTPGSGDGGADLICRHPGGGRPVIVQAKHRQMGRGTVGDEAVSEVRGAIARYAHHDWLRNPTLIVATNGRSELRARTAAEQVGVRIVDRPEIVALAGLARRLLAA